MLPAGRTPSGHVAFAPVHLAPLDSGDALQCERENMQLVTENDGDFLFQLKGNQPTALTEDQANRQHQPRER